MDFSKVAMIDATKVEQMLLMDELITAVESGLSSFSAKNIVQPVRLAIPVTANPRTANEKTHGFFGCMPVYSSDQNVLSCKLVSFYPSNASRGKPTHYATIMLFDPICGELKAILDGEVITALRTAATSAIATKYLLREDLKTQGIHLALIGSGTQARAHAQALRTLFDVRKITVWSPNSEHSQSCADDVGGVVCSSAKEAVNDADVICTVTFSTTPVIMKDWIKPGAHVNAVGACRHDWQELDGELMRQGVIYVDSREAALVEAGDIILSKAEIYAEIGEVINGKEIRREPYTVFKSLGMAIEDAVAANLVFSKVASETTNLMPETPAKPKL